MILSQASSSNPSMPSPIQSGLRPSAAPAKDNSKTNRPRRNHHLVEKCTDQRFCHRCQIDGAFLRSTRRPPLDIRNTVLSVVDLFAGCGGMTVGLEEAARLIDCELTVSLAVDSDSEATAIYESNFPRAEVRTQNVETIFDGCIDGPLTTSESLIAHELGSIDVLVGGPPCQGHSDLNNHTRRKDPKNVLLLRMVRAAQVLLPSVVIIENVPAVRHDKEEVVSLASIALKSSGYQVSEGVLDLSKMGVPQRRRRFLLLASRLAALDPARVLEELAGVMPDHRGRTVRWAIGDLAHKMPATIFDTPSNVTPKNRTRIKLLFRHKLFDLPNRYRPECHSVGNHSYKSMYGRLRWSLPAQTVTTGFGSMGQGRYVHPERPRTLTPHEAARLQTFPDWFDFGPEARRGVLAKVIGNAVPPLMMLQLGKIILPSLVRATKSSSEQERKRA
jgi:DNA (cytosine-5)-methyltransferase 1